VTRRRTGQQSDRSAGHR